LSHFECDLHQVIDNALENGIERLIVPGINLSTSIEAISLAEKYNELFAAIGVHPNDSDSWSDHQYQEFKSLAKHPKVVAIGEIGLDYYRNYSPADLQKAVFTKQLDLAANLSKPVIIHFRNAFHELWQILMQMGFCSLGAGNFFRGVFHSFSGSLDNAQTVYKNGFKIGISGPVTYKSGNEIQEIVAKIPLEHIVVETDSPYLSPVPHRGKRNEPGFLVEIVRKMAEIKKISYEEISYQTSKNAAELFGVGA
jgi:TatD DNase family protein